MFVLVNKKVCYAAEEKKYGGSRVVAAPPVTGHDIVCLIRYRRVVEVPPPLSISRFVVCVFPFIVLGLRSEG